MTRDPSQPRLRVGGALVRFGAWGFGCRKITAKGGSHERSRHRPLSPQRGDTAVECAPNLYFSSRARVARVLALSIVIWLIPPVGIASELLEQKFDGVVVPRQWVQVVPQINGVVSRILFVPGQRVSKGDVLFEMDADDFAIDVRIAQSELDEARARLSLAQDAAERQALLLRQNATAQQLARQTEILVEIARASVAHKEGTLAKAQLALSRTRVVAPLAGTVGRPLVAPGAFVETGTRSETSPRHSRALCCCHHQCHPTHMAGKTADWGPHRTKLKSRRSPNLGHTHW